MGDMGDFFRDWRQLNKERRERNLTAAQTIAENFTIHTEWHWSTMCCADRLDYWPSTNKWMWRGKKYTGTPEQLMNFMCNREAEEPEGRPL